MSRIGRKPIAIPSGVEIKKTGTLLSVKGPKGTLSANVHMSVNVEQNKNELFCTVSETTKFVKALHGLWRANLNNMILGVTNGHEKKLEIIGVGYKAEILGKRIRLLLGFSHPILLSVPDGITIKTPTPTSIVINGADKTLVGQVAAKIRSFRPPEPYKGKGVRYAGEYVRKKAGKAAATAGK
ncbi:MAG: 50S ribosomal protein L6 [Ignavibacteria bacterium]|nr:50S ribosomal protein L6 [Ignavibacteria bacterium]